MKLRSLSRRLLRRPAPGACQIGLWYDHARLLSPDPTGLASFMIDVAVHEALRRTVTGSRLRW